MKRFVAVFALFLIETSTAQAKFHFNIPSSHHPPITIELPQGQIEGFTAELWSEIFRGSPDTYTMSLLPTFRFIEKTTAEEFPLFLTYGEPRLKQGRYFFTHAFGMQFVLVQKKDRKARAAKTVRKMAVIYETCADESELKKILGKHQIIQVESNASALKMLEDGRVDSACMFDHSFLYEQTYRPDAFRNFTKVDVGPALEINFFLKKDLPEKSFTFLKNRIEKTKASPAYKDLLYKYNLRP